MVATAYRFVQEGRNEELYRACCMSGERAQEQFVTSY